MSDENAITARITSVRTHNREAPYECTIELQVLVSPEERARLTEVMHYGTEFTLGVPPAQSDMEERLRNVETWCARTSPRDVWGAFKRPEWLKDAAFLADAGEP